MGKSTLTLLMQYRHIEHLHEEVFDVKNIFFDKMTAL